MIDPAHDEQIARLQRLAYGADTPAAERAEAEEELRALASTPDASEKAPPTPLPAPPEPPTSAAHPVEHRLRWAIIAGTLALVIGLLAGWQFGARTPALQPDAEPADRQGVIGVVDEVGVEDTAAYLVFDREQVPEDLPAVDVSGGGADESSLRRLATRSDGVAVFAAKTDGGVCVIIAFEALGGSASSCTTNGMIPVDGLWVTGSFLGGSGDVLARWRPEGTVELTIAP